MALNNFQNLKTVLPKQGPNKPLDTNKLASIGSNIESLGKITTPFGGSTHYDGNHQGVDIATNIGKKIGAISSGTVVESVNGRQQNINPTSDNSAYGNYITVKDNNGNTVRYSHLDEAYVPVGRKISKGQSIGTVGNSGNTYSNNGGDGAHLDLRVQNAAKRYLNPLKYSKKSK